jgi:hypothetical protein
MRSRREFLVVRNFVLRGCSDREISQKTGIPRRTISDWRRGKPPNAAQGRGSHDYRCHNRHDFSVLDTAQYAYLLGLYLGDGCISATHRGVYCMRIMLDAAYPGIVGECCAALESIFPSKAAHPGMRRDCNCVEVSMWSKHWPCFFPQHGPGRKHLRHIRLVQWQQEIVEASRKPFIRGLIHSDGTRIIATERKGSYVRRAPMCGGRRDTHSATSLRTSSDCSARAATPLASDGPALQIAKSRSIARPRSRSSMSSSVRSDSPAHTA